jgi:hypothetical protein
MLWEDGSETVFYNAISNIVIELLLQKEGVFKGVLNKIDFDFYYFPLVL